MKRKIKGFGITLNKKDVLKNIKGFTSKLPTKEGTYLMIRTMFPAPQAVQIKKRNGELFVHPLNSFPFRIKPYKLKNLVGRGGSWLWKKTDDVEKELREWLRKE